MLFSDTEASAERQELHLRERGIKKVHIYESWAWRDEAPEEAPDWMPDEITEANVAKQGFEHLEKI